MGIKVTFFSEEKKQKNILLPFNMSLVLTTFNSSCGYTKEKTGYTYSGELACCGAAVLELFRCNNGPDISIIITTLVNQTRLSNGFYFFTS